MFTQPRATVVGPATLRAFSLVELLVVIAIIALLVSILLPSLAAARDAARTLVCGTQVRNIAQMQASYAADNKDWLAGSPQTSGFDCLPPSAAYSKTTPATFNGIATQSWDYLGPLAYASGYAGPGEQGSSGAPTPADRAARFDWLRTYPMFLCPSNNITATPFDPGGTPITAGRMLSYNSSSGFLGGERNTPLGTLPGSSPQNRRGYVPQISRVGSGALKVVAFEGHRFARPTEAEEPDFDFGIAAGYGGSFGGVGAWWSRSAELNRARAPGESGRLAFLANPQQFNDFRRFAFRHGGRSGPKDTKEAPAIGNVAFFDGSVRAMNDGEATNPDLWFPTGTTWTQPLETWNYTRQTWLAKTQPNYVVP
ncbi:MAG: type II secretion system protein [Phycisphaerae bacterium]|nr:type II secretion system protein [Phycisphaerae bacterium]